MVFRAKPYNMDSFVVNDLQAKRKTLEENRLEAEKELQSLREKYKNKKGNWINYLSFIELIVKHISLAL